MKTFKTYEPPFAEVITIEAQGVLCASYVTAGAPGTQNMTMSADNSAIVM